MKTVKPGNIANYLFAALSLAIGIIYLTRSSFMPYHQDALAINWNEVEKNTRFLILALMRAVAGGFIVSAVSIVLLQYKFSVSRHAWIPPLIFITGIIIESTTLYAVMLVRMNTPGNPPVSLIIAGLILLVAGYVFNLKTLHKEIK